MRNWLLVGAMSILVACGGGGGGNTASGVEAGPPPPGGSVPPPPPNPPAPFAPYADAETLLATITSVTLDDDERAIVEFQLTDGHGTAIVDLGARDVRFTIAKLQVTQLGNLTGIWQSYKNTIQQPEVGIGTEKRLQATYERDAEGGEFTNNGDGTYRYHFELSLTNLGQPVLDQAATEGLDLSYEPDFTHRVGMQFDGSESWANPNYDWVPATGATDGIFTMDIAATDNCNRCHDPLGVHGGGVGPRREVKYCVTCHNAGTTDPDSTNTVDMKVMIHKIHMGANLPSVLAGEPYVIYGFGGSAHDYSKLHYPQDIRNCVNCHVGTETVGDREDLVLTNQGDNWAQYPTAAACGSCHDDKLGPDDHIGSKPDDSECASCHSTGGRAGSIEDSHRMPIAEAGEHFAAEIQAVTNTGPGEFPQVQYKIFDPTNGDAPYDLQNDPVWTAGGGASRLAIDLAWDTTDYTNSGNEETHASAVSLDALQGTPVGDGSYTIESTVAIPDGSLSPGIAATGSGVVGVEGHPAVNVGSDSKPDVQRIPFTSANAFFSIDEADGKPVDRREVVELEGGCLNCHQTLSLHGSNRTDNVQVCVACHNPRNTDRQVREIAGTPPSDGKDEESIDFKTMIHGIHAAGMRENALQIVGFGGFSTHVYDEEAVHYPGNLANCATCHAEGTFELPLASGVLATTVDTGADTNDPDDDTVVTPISAVCSSCHDDSESASHMTAHGGNFSTTQSAIDSGEVFEDCNACHREGSGVADAWEIHQEFLN
jgi:OmcA/MtrC family decaheme c-type cytochrome